MGVKGRERDGKVGGGRLGVCEWDVSETVLRKGESGCERVGMGREWSGAQGGEWSVRGRVGARGLEGESKVRGGGCSLGGESGVGCKSERGRECGARGRE